MNIFATGNRIHDYSLAIVACTPTEKTFILSNLKVMNTSVNKDLLVAVMSQRQAELEKLVKLQSTQLENYRVHIEGFKARVSSYEKQIAVLETMIATEKEKAEVQTQRESNLKSMVDTLNELKENLLSKIELHKTENELLLARIQELEAHTTELE